MLLVLLAITGSSMGELKMKKNKILLLLSFFVPVAALVVIFALCRVSPFGDKNILISDMGLQYYPFIADYLQRLKEGRSLFWSWSLGGGADYLTVFTYYLSSPLNLLLLLVPQSVLPEAVVFLIIFKIGLAGLFMGIFLMDCFAVKLRRTSSPGPVSNGGFAIPLFATFYTLSSFVTLYYWSITWLDAFALLPLIILGEKALIREGKFKLYIITLSLSIITNLYFSFYTCVFVAITFFAESFIQKPALKEFLRKLVLIAVSSVIAIGITALLTLPAYIYIVNVAGASNSTQFRGVIFGNYLKDVIGTLLAFSQVGANINLPNLYCGMLCVILIGPYLGSAKIKLREKLAFVVIAAFMLLSFNLNALDYMWNAFRYVNGMPFRYIYVFFFTVITAAYQSFIIIYEEGFKRKNLLLVAAVAIPVLLVAMIGIGAVNVLSNAVIIMGYLLIFAVMNTARDLKDKEKAIMKIIVAVAIIAAVFAETGINAYKTMSSNIATIWDGYFDNYAETRAALSILDESSSSSDFYRVELTAQYMENYIRQFNDPALFGYNGLSFYSSTIAEGMAGFYNNAGLPVVTANAYSYSAYSHCLGTPLINMFLNLRYLVSDNDALTNDDIFWDVKSEADWGLAILENKKYLPLGFMTRDGILDYAANKANPFITQNNLFNAATGLDGVLFKLITPIDITSDSYTVIPDTDGIYDYKKDQNGAGGIVFSYEMPASGMLYIRLSPGTNAAISGQNDTAAREIINRFPYIIPAGYFAKGETVSLSPAMTAYTHPIGSTPMTAGKLSLYAAVMNEGLFNAGYDILADETLEITEFRDTYIRGEITALTDGLLYTSIPLSDNWTAYVNSVKTEITAVNGAMAGLKVSAGEHIIEFRYFNKMFAVGIVISLISLGAFAVMWRGLPRRFKVNSSQ